MPTIATGLIRWWRDAFSRRSRRLLLSPNRHPLLLCVISPNKDEGFFHVNSGFVSCITSQKLVLAATMFQEKSLLAHDLTASTIFGITREKAAREEDRFSCD